MKNWYKELEQRFITFEPHLQMLNLVSDLVKAKNLFSTNSQNAKENCLRAIILLDYIISDPKWNSKQKELFRLREVLASLTTDAPMATMDQAITSSLLMEQKAYRVYYNIQGSSAAGSY